MSDPEFPCPEEGCDEVFTGPGANLAVVNHVSAAHMRAAGAVRRTEGADEAQRGQNEAQRAAQPMWPRAGRSNVADVGYTCADGYEYSICRHCCTGDSGFQSEECAGHSRPCWPCATVAALQGDQPGQDTTQEIDDEEVNRQFGGSEAGGDAPGPEEAA